MSLEQRARQEKERLQHEEREKNLQKLMLKRFMNDLVEKERWAEQSGDRVALNGIRKQFWYYHDMLQQLEGNHQNKSMTEEKKQKLSIAAKVLTGLQIAFSGVKMAGSALMSIVKGVASALFAIGKGTFVSTKILVGLPVKVVKATVSLIKLIGSAAKTIGKGALKITKRKAWAKIFKAVSGVLLAMVPFCGEHASHIKVEAKVSADASRGVSASANIEIGTHSEREVSRGTSTKNFRGK